MIQPDIHDKQRIYVGIELGGVMKSVDQGKSWEDRKAGSQFDSHDLTMTNKAAGRIYEAAGERVCRKLRQWKDTWDDGSINIFLTEQLTFWS